METLVAYIPADRRLALAEGRELPAQTTGAALFADISGFTPLTEELVRILGAQRGPEELTRQLNVVYDALIADVDRFGGSVIGFSGDAITCWFDGDDGRRATACALAMQQAMVQFAVVPLPSGGSVTLTVKVAVAIGPVQRFVVGDPQVQLIDLLAGRTLELLAIAEHMAVKGEVILDQDAAVALNNLIDVAEWRTDEESGRQVAVVVGLLVAVDEAPWPMLAPDVFPAELVRPWILPAVYRHLSVGQGEFLAELRPAVALFLRFIGLDYDADPQASWTLDQFVRTVQAVLELYEGTLIQVTIGDKGSFLYAAFGAPIAHEDDVLRATQAALELRALAQRIPEIVLVQIGMSIGRMRTGSYGSITRRTYGVLGDETNLAARLMMAAQPGQIIASERVYQLAGDLADWERLPAINVKGKIKPITIFALNGLQQRARLRLHEPRYALPMVGRQTELALVVRQLDLVLRKQGQIVAITGEVGMGKSRLVAEVIQTAQAHGLVGFAGECASYGTNSSYLVWRTIWQDLLEIDPTEALETQLPRLEEELRQAGPLLVSRLPLLGTLLNLPIPDNDLTSSLDARQRKMALELLLVSYLRIRAQRGPLLLVLEDCHWLDPLSQELLELVGRLIVDLPVLLLIAHRPFEQVRLSDWALNSLPNYTEILIGDFSSQEAEQLLKLKLTQIYGQSNDRTMSPAFVERILKRSQGNPFFVEELVNYIHALSLDPSDDNLLDHLDLPTTVQSLILSRIDQLTEEQRTVLRLASVIGRLFPAAMLWGAYPQLGNAEEVLSSLTLLSRVELMNLERPEPELSYIFKHIVTQEVSYESLPFATRAVLHNQIGSYIEQHFSEQLDQYLDLLAFHFDRSTNEEKRRLYLLRAGEAAQEAYANAAAIDYYQRLLALLPLEQRPAVLLRLGKVKELVGLWVEAGERYREALALCEQLGDQLGEAQARLEIGLLLWRQGEYSEAQPWATQARAAFETQNNRSGLARALNLGGLIADCQADYATAQSLYESSIAIWREVDNPVRLAETISNLGVMACYKGDYDQARVVHEEALAIRRAIGHRWGLAVSLNNLGTVLCYQGDYAAAAQSIEEGLLLMRQIGDRGMLVNFLMNLGEVACARQDVAAARALLEESLLINRDLGDKWVLTYLLENIGHLMVLQGRYDRSLRVLGAAAALREQIGAPLSASEQERLAQNFASAYASLPNEEQTALHAAGVALSLDESISEALALLSEAT